MSGSLQEEFQDKATYKDVWQHRRVIVSGRIKYDKDGDILYLVANDIRRIVLSRSFFGSNKRPGVYGRPTDW